MVWYQMGSENLKPNHLKSGQMAAILLKTIWNQDKNIRILNGPLKPIVIECNGIHFIWNKSFSKYSEIWVHTWKIELLNVYQLLSNF